jgi:hypothetical protein
VVARNGHDLAVGRLGRHAERVSVALDDEHGHVDGVELGKARLLGPARRVDGEREAQDRCRVGLGCGPAGDPGAGRASAGDQRQAVERELLDDGLPGAVELRGGRRRAAAGDEIGLLDERDGHVARERRLGGGLEVGRVDRAAGAVAEDQRGLWVRRLVERRPGRAVRCVDVHRRDCANEPRLGRGRGCRRGWTAVGSLRRAYRD